MEITVSSKHSRMYLKGVSAGIPSILTKLLVVFLVCWANAGVAPALKLEVFLPHPFQFNIH
jgi:hypothetical protein